MFVPNDVVMQSWEHEITNAYDEESRPNIFRLNNNLNETETTLRELSKGGVGLITYRKILSRGFENY